MNRVPTLEADRLLLREWCDSDLPAFRAIRADPLVARHLGDGRRLFSEEANLRSRTTASIGARSASVAGRSSGGRPVRPFANCGLLRCEELAALELGYGFARRTWGRGHPTEAARAAIGWGLDHAEAESIVATTHTENVASQRVLVKLGFVSAGEVDGQFYQLRFFSLSGSAFRWE